MIFGYTRCSTAEQADGSTLQEQERVIRGYAMAKGVAAFDLQIFVDEGVSGSIPMRWRPAGGDLLAVVKAGDTVVASKLDRMFRNALDALNTFNDFKQRDIHLVLFDLGIEPVTGDTGMAKLIFQIMAAVADHERDRIRERMADGKRAKREKGGHAGGLAPYGYRIVGSKREARLEIDEKEQELIRVVTRSRLPPYRLAQHLNEKGFNTRSGKPFHMAQVLRILEKHKNDATAH